MIIIETQHKYVLRRGFKNYRAFSLTLNPYPNSEGLLTFC